MLAIAAFLASGLSAVPLATPAVAASTIAASAPATAAAPVVSAPPMTPTCDKKPVMPASTTPAALAALPVVARTATSTTYQSSCNTRTVEIHSTPVNWQDSTGAWHATDPHLVPASAGHWKNASGPFTVDLADSADAGSLASLADGNWSVGFAVAGASPAKATITGETATYHDAMPNVDVTESVTSSGVKESIFVKSLPPGSGDLTYQFPLNLNGVTPATATDGTITFTANGTPVAALAPAVAWDANKSTLPGDVEPITQTLVRQGTGWAVRLDVPAAWARNTARALPITIDPTVTRTGNGSAGCSTPPSPNPDQDAFASSPAPSTVFCDFTWTEADHIVHHEDWVGYDNYPSSQDWAYQNFDMTGLIGKDILTADWYDVVIATKAGNPNYLNYFKMAQVTGWPGGVWNINNVNWATAGDTGSIPHSSTNWHDVWAAPGTQAHVNVLSDVVFWANQSVPALGFEFDTAGQNDAVHLASDQEVGNTGPSIVVTYNTVPNVPDQLSPASGWTGPSSAPTLSAHYSDPDGDNGNINFEVTGPGGYDVTQPVGVTNGGTATWTPSISTPGVYSWHADAWDGRDTSPWSGWQTFTIGDNPPNTPDTLSPGDGFLDTQLDPLSARYSDPDTFSNPANNVGSLQFAINGVGTYNIGGLANGAIGTCAVATCVPSTLATGVYSWQVRSIDITGAASAWSPWREFTYQPGAQWTRDEFNGTSWNTTKWTTTSGGLSIGSANGWPAALGSGTQGIFPAVSSSQRATLTGPSLSDSEVSLTYAFPDTNSGTSLRITLRGGPGTAASQLQNGYRLDIPSGSNTITLNKMVNGALVSPALGSFTYSSSTSPQRVRFVAGGSTLAARIWPAGTLEPSTWSLLVTDTNTPIAGPGTLQLANAWQSTGRTLAVDDLTYSTALPPTGACQTAQPAYPPTSVAGPPPDGSQFDATASSQEDVITVFGLDTFEPAMENQFSTRYGGSWFDNSVSPSILCVGMVNATASDMGAIRANFSGPAWRLVIVNSKYSQTQIENFHSSIDSVVANHTSPTYQTSEVGSRYALSAVAVITDVQDTRLQNEILAVVPADAVIFQTVSDLAVAPTSRDSYPPYTGGRNITISGGGGSPTVGCTAGFMMNASTSSGTLPVGTTAGHCALQNDTVTIGGNFVGVVDSDPYRNNGTNDDAAYYELSPSTGQPQVYITTDTTPSGPVDRTKPVYAEAGHYEHKDGQSVCVNARFTQGCGQIVSDNETVSQSYVDARTGKTESHAWYNVVCYSLAGQEGDSGGPVFQYLNGTDGVRAMGLATLAFYGKYSGQRLNRSCYTRIDKIEKTLSATLAEAPH